MMLTLQRMWLQITADRKRFGVLCGAVAVGLLLWSRLIVVSNLPRTAIAEDDAALAETQPQQSQQAPPSENGRGADNSTSPAIAVTLHSLPNHDPFEINSDVFPPRLVENNGQVGEKSTRNPADNLFDAEARRTEQLRAMVNQLTLEAVMLQDVPLVVINSKTYRQGDLVPALKDDSISFRLSEVNRRSIVLEYDGRMFELKMTSPAGLDARQSQERHDAAPGHSED
jgi:hypothetical protein